MGHINIAVTNQAEADACLNQLMPLLDDTHQKALENGMSELLGVL